MPILSSLAFGTAAYGFRVSGGSIPMIASGGNSKYTSGAFTYHRYTSTGNQNFDISQASGKAGDEFSQVDVAAVGAGGGGGGRDGPPGAGGAAGGIAVGYGVNVSQGQRLQVYVGGGGNGGFGCVSNNGRGNGGTNGGAPGGQAGNNGCSGGGGGSGGWSGIRNNGTSTYHVVGGGGSGGGGSNEGPANDRPSRGGGKQPNGARNGNMNGGGGCKYCFLAGSKVTMADGSLKNIEDVLVGESVMGEDGSNTVLDCIHTILANRKLGGINGVYFASEDHPFMTTEGWKTFNPELARQVHPDLEHLDIQALEVGDEIITMSSGSGSTLVQTKVKVDSIQLKEAPFLTRLYNFRLDGDHTFYCQPPLPVEHPETGDEVESALRNSAYLVHNKDGGGYAGGGGGYWGGNGQCGNQCSGGGNYVNSGNCTRGGDTVSGNDGNQGGRGNSVSYNSQGWSISGYGNGGNRNGGGGGSGVAFIRYLTG